MSMFTQSYVEEAHRIALEAALRGRTSLTPPLLLKLYKHAHDAALTAPSKENGFFHSRIQTDAYVVGTCTDAKTGFCVQLVKRNNEPHMLLTVGQKFAMENVDAVRGNINTQFWQA